MAGIRLELAPGWRTYWRAPGDAGIPPAFTWEGSENIAAVQFHWPVPTVWQSNGMQSIGYAGHVVIPVELTPAQAGQQARMSGEVEIGVCDDICIPVTLDFEALLPPGGVRDATIVAALIDRPLTSAQGQVAGVECSATPIDHGLRLTAILSLPDTGAPEVVVIETDDPRVWISEAATQRIGRTLTARVDMVHPDGGFALDRSVLRFTILGSDRAVDIRGCSGS